MAQAKYFPLLLLFFLFSFFKSWAQPVTIPGYQTVNNGWNILRSVNRALNIPVGGTAALTVGQTRISGAIYYDSTGTDTGFYVFHNPYWVKLAAAASIVGSTNTNVGVPGFNIGVEGTNNIKRLRDSTYWKLDSSIANTLRGYIDTAALFTRLRLTLPVAGGDNGVSLFSTRNIQLGQAVGAPGNPATITADREIPMIDGTAILLKSTTAGTGAFRLWPGSARFFYPTGPALAFAMNPTGAGRAFAGINFARSVDVSGAGESVLAVLNTDLGPTTHHLAFDFRNEIDALLIEVGGTNGFGQPTGVGQQIRDVFDAYGGVALAANGTKKGVIIGGYETGWLTYPTKALLEVRGSSYFTDSVRISTMLTGVGGTDSVLVTKDGIIKRVLASTVGVGSYNLANFYLKDSTLSSNRFVDINTRTLRFTNGAAFSSTGLYIDPTVNSEVGYLGVHNTASSSNGYFFAASTNVNTEVNISSYFGANFANIQLLSTTSARTISATANSITLSSDSSYFATTLSGSTVGMVATLINPTSGSWHWAAAAGGSGTWNGITNPTGDQALTFDAGESSTWTNANTTEDLFTVNTSTITSSSLFSINSTSTALAAGNNLVELIMSGANGTAAITANPLRISVTNTNATSGTNVGLDVTASGATTANYSIKATGMGWVRANTSTAASGDGSHTFEVGSNGNTSLGIYSSSGSNSATLDFNFAAFSHFYNVADATATELYWANGAFTKYMRMLANGKMSFGNPAPTPTAWATFAPGTTAAGTAPEKFTSGPLMTTAEAGAVEFLTDKFYGTITTGAARKEYTLNDAALTSGTTPVATTNGRLTDGLIFAQGTYTPTLTNVANLDASTAYSCQYMRVGNTVTVSGRVDIDPTLTATSTQLGISLPIASALANANELGGASASPTIVSQSAAILGDATNDRAQLQYMSTDVTNQAMYFSFTYRII